MAGPEPTRPSTRVEVLEQRLHALKRERERLRSRDAGRDELEENRRAIAESQRELSVALIARHGPSFQPV
jgi:hypothetical protein